MILASTRRTFRIVVVTTALALVTTVGASADVLTPLEDTGGPGGGGGFGGQLDESARAQDLQALTGAPVVAGTYDDLLAGSGYESAEAQASAPTIAETRGTDRTVATSAQDDVLAGSGYEQPAAVAEHPTQNAQSIDRIESTQTATGALAGGEAEAPQATSPNRSAF